MSSAEVNAIIKEQYQVAEFEQRVCEAMDMVANNKRLKVAEKLEIVDQLRTLSKDTMYGFHTVNGQLQRVPPSINSKQYDNKSNDPVKLAQTLISK